LLNASVGVQRVLGRVRRTSIDSMIAMPRPTRPRSSAGAERARRSYILSSRHIYPLPRPRRRRLTLLPALARHPLALHRPQVSLHRPTVRLRRLSARELMWVLSPVVRRSVAGLGHERVVAIAAAGILLSASFLSVTPGGPRGDTGGPTGDGPGPRLAIAGTSNDEDTGSIVEDYVNSGDATGDGTEGTSGADTTSMTEGYLGSGLDGMNRFEEAVALGGAPAHVHGPFLEDGTLLKPVAVDTSVPDGSDLLRTYKVKSGDTLATIANKFDISMMTLWWANKLKSKNQLHIGQQLRIPPVSGVVVEVTPNDTLTGLAAKYKVDENDILTTNGLDDRNLVVGQVLMLPGALGSEIRVSTPRRSSHAKSLVTRPTVHRSNGGGRPVPPPSHYSGGRMLWPTTSHHISQYYHYGHWAIDIDGSTGDPIFAAASGTVIFAGWKNNGGGYQVWIAHGSNLYTTYNHMSSVSVGRGQTVGRGQRVGRMGATGFATGSHLHFEVWRGPIWNGGTRVNPLGYL
jgi:murein DD-endopeptidase MepM/ murein hydrolase activator NlpD